MSPALDAQLRVVVGGGARAFTALATLALPAGVLVLFGPSGVGKTVTLQALAGRIRPAEGHLRVGGETLFDSAREIMVPAHERRVGYVPQQHALFPFLDVEENVAFGLPRAERRKSPKVRALLDELGLAHLASARPDSLSGGERQRVALARALAVEPKLLLLDEPFASIDREGRAALRKLLREAIDRRAMPAVLVTHDRDEAVELGDVLVRFERGKTTESGAPGALLGHAGLVVSGQLEGAVEPLPDGRARARLRGAMVEGPGELLRGDEAGTVKIAAKPG